MTAKQPSAAGAACAFCDSTDLGLVMDFGEVALAGGFLKAVDVPKERKYPLRLSFCRQCYGVQVIDKVEEDVLFRDYFYFSSSIRTLREHFEAYAAELT